MPLPFRETQQIGLGIDEQLFSRFLDGEAFTQWHKDGRTWQLRYVGGPGSGKTTLSLLAIRRLEQAFTRDEASVASVFFDKPIENARTTVPMLLNSILQQLSFDHNRSPSKASSGNARSQGGDLNLNAVHEALSQRLQQIPRAFVVLDDFDLCGADLAIAIEEELSWLQDEGVSILVTSRVFRNHNLLEFRCDATPDDLLHSDELLFVHWLCATCRENRREFEIGGPVDICSAHVVDYVCPRCDSRTNMIEPYRCVDIAISVSEDDMRRFIAAELESSHGDLGLGSSCNPKPLRSKLGRSLTNGHSSYSAHGLLDRIVSYADGNIAMAKLRLENIEIAQSVDDLLHVGDRLPDNILFAFDSGVKRILQKPEPYRTIGLKVLVGVASADDFMPFLTLQQWLDREAALTSPPSAGIPEYTIEQLVHAAAGFVTCDAWANDEQFFMYNMALRSYVREDYNESLLWVRSQMQLGVLSRSSSMVFSSLKMTRASKPKFRLQSQGFGVKMTGVKAPTFLKDDKTRTVPKRQTSEPGRTKEEKKHDRDFPRMKRSTTWL